MSPQIASLHEEYQRCMSSPSDEIAISIRVPYQQSNQRHYLKNSPRQNSTPQMRRQQAFDMPTTCTGQTRNAVSTTWLSANNSFESNTTTSPSTQKLRQQQWSKQQSSLNSSNHSNGDIRSHTNRSRKNSVFELKENARRKFSLIPQVSCCASDGVSITIIIHHQLYTVVVQCLLCVCLGCDDHLSLSLCHFLPLFPNWSGLH